MSDFSCFENSVYNKVFSHMSSTRMWCHVQGDYVNMIVLALLTYFRMFDSDYYTFEIRVIKFAYFVMVQYHI